MISIKINFFPRVFDVQTDILPEERSGASDGMLSPAHLPLWAKRNETAPAPVHHTHTRSLAECQVNSLCVFLSFSWFHLRSTMCISNLRWTKNTRVVVVVVMMDVMV